MWSEKFGKIHVKTPVPEPPLISCFPISFAKYFREPPGSEIGLSI